MSNIADFSLSGRTALVTGAGRGLGVGMAEALAGAGADVVLLSRTRTELEAVASRIGEAGGRSSVLPCDVTDDHAVGAAIAGLDALDILVNNAGTNIPQAFVEVTAEALDTMLNLNIRSAFMVAQAGPASRRDQRSIDLEELRLTSLCSNDDEADDELVDDASW